ncbi:MAG: GAF domain-containing protein, partial [Acidobacteria bacterium]|nr:GAF domain-containing protein [Acidobacteriota bacterium]
MSERDILLTMFDLGRQVTAVLDVNELLQKTPELIRRLIPFDAFAVYLLDEKRNELSIAYAVGYPDHKPFRVRVSEGIVGRVVESQQGLVIGDVSADPHYITVVPGMASTLAVPLIYKKKAVGALNILSRTRDQYSDQDAAILRQFAAHVAVALVNARLFERERADAEAFEMLAEIGKEVASVLDLDQLLSNIAQLTRRVVDYRTFGILLYDEARQELEM